jgi:hypothetical protein
MLVGEFRGHILNWRIIALLISPATVAFNKMEARTYMSASCNAKIQPILYEIV